MEKIEGKKIYHVEVCINKTSNYPTPFGLIYDAKGFYIQGKYIIVVGNMDTNSTIRIKYPLKDVSIRLIIL